jgi:hypothetical protein
MIRLVDRSKPAIDTIISLKRCRVLNWIFTDEEHLLKQTTQYNVLRVTAAKQSITTEFQSRIYIQGALVWHAKWIIFEM